MDAQLFKNPVMWAYDVFVVRKQDEDMSLICSAGGYLTIEPAFERAFEEGLYYLGVCKYETYVEIYPQCKRCNGTAQLTSGKRVKRYKPCPDCKNNEFNKYRIGPIQIKANKQVQLSEAIQYWRVNKGIVDIPPGDYTMKYKENDDTTLVLTSKDGAIHFTFKANKLDEYRHQGYIMGL